MRLRFREIAVVLSAATLIFFCSCERHHPDELAGEPKAAPPAHEHGAPPAAKSSATPAQFFPESTPH